MEKTHGKGDRALPDIPIDFLGSFALANEIAVTAAFIEEVEELEGGKSCGSVEMAERRALPRQDHIPLAVHDAERDPDSGRIGLGIIGCSRREKSVPRCEAEACSVAWIRGQDTDRAAATHRMAGQGHTLHVEGTGEDGMAIVVLSGQSKEQRPSVFGLTLWQDARRVTHHGDVAIFSQSSTQSDIPVSEGSKSMQKDDDRPAFWMGAWS